MAPLSTTISHTIARYHSPSTQIYS